MNGREFAEAVNRPHGTVKRWLSLKKNPLPHRKWGQAVIIDLEEGKRWVAAYELKHGNRRTNTVRRIRASRV